MYSTAIGSSSNVAIKLLMHALALGSFENSQISALRSVRRPNGRASK